ncbi:MAG: hypothetical protein IJY57_05015 [Clostridia bacterium]|nr:hypothetical protein [Clostridia bacterium]
MKISDIVNCVATYLARENVLKYLNGETENIGDAKEQIDTMVRACNLVIGELASSYIPMVKREKVIPTDSKVYYGSLTETAVEILAVENESGKSAVYDFSPEYLKTGVSPAVIVYKYLPANYDLNDTVGFDAKVSARILAYGVAAEITLIERNFDESVNWRKRYTNAVSLLTEPKSFVMAKRRWL